MKINTNKGITLIALVVTIIVLLILASVGIGSILGGNGIVKQAESAKEAWEETKNRQEQDAYGILEHLEGYLDDEEKVESTSNLWEFNSETGYITRYKGEDASTITELNIPNYIDGVKVVGIGPCDTNIMGAKEVALKKVNIPSGITTIKDNCFKDCTNLSEVTLPEGVTTIGLSAFETCNLTSFTIPSTVTSISKRILAENKNLTTIVSKSKDYVSIDNVLYTADKKTLIQYPLGSEETEYETVAECTKIEERSMLEADNLVTLTLGQNVTKIDDEAISYCSKLKTVSSNGVVKEINPGAFAGDVCLEEIDLLKEGLAVIGDLTFYACEKIKTDLVIPSTVTYIGQQAFSGLEACNSLTVVTTNKNFRAENNVLISKEGVLIGTLATKTGECVIPNDVTSIGKEAFYHCNKITAITIPSTVTSIGNNAFYKTYSLKTLTIQKPEGSITGSPWGADTGVTTINWTGN